MSAEKDAPEDRYVTFSDIIKPTRLLLAHDVVGGDHEAGTLDCRCGLTNLTVSEWITHNPVLAARVRAEREAVQSEVRSTLQHGGEHLHYDGTHWVSLLYVLDALDHNGTSPIPPAERSE